MKTDDAIHLAAQLNVPEMVPERLIAILQSFDAVEKAVVFGSRAKGTSKPHSDIDLSLFGNALDWHTLTRIELALDELNLIYKTDVNIFHLLQNEALQEHILRVGIVIFERP